MHTDPAAAPTSETPEMPAALKCDLVMKGGITSGVIYPKLIHKLSMFYRFKNIGGTSAGAIAAGACAAAEYARREGRPEAFDRLKELPKELGDTVQPSNRSRLLSLFQPAPSLQPHFAVLLRALNQSRRPAVVGMLFRMLANHPILAAAVLLAGVALLAPLSLSLSPLVSAWSALGVSLATLVVLGLALHWAAAHANVLQAVLLGIAVYILLVLALLGLFSAPLSWALAVVALSLLVGGLLTWVLSIGVSGRRFFITLLRGLHRNHYGMCSGLTMTARTGATDALPGLTDWLTGYLDTLAGVSTRAHPLTFGDLWGGTDRHAPNAVNLEVMTSAVSQQMVYGIPFREGTPTLYYDPQEFKRLFPSKVMDWIERAATEAEQVGPKGLRPDGYTSTATILNHDGRRLRPLPRGADLPVVVAIRMSLSFPVLLSAIPLYSVDFTVAKNQEEKRRMRAAGSQTVFEATRIWFSDGGIGSNMPLHMFDALLPGHPTFAVNLKAEYPTGSIRQPETPENKDGRIFLPKDNRAGALRHWDHPGDDKPFGGLVGFLGSIVNTMQNWRDEIQFPYPGFKDRIVQISQGSAEGGLNLDMPAETIRDLGNAGEMAAQRLIDRFHPDGAQAGAGWRNHQTIRLRTFLGTMQPGAAALHSTLNTDHWVNLTASVTNYRAVEQQLTQEFLAGLGQLGALGQQGTPPVSLATGAPRPLAQIRIGPKI